MGLIIEGGIYFLLIFTPFAFGGVETWAQGVLQIVAGAVVAAWAWSFDGLSSTAAGSRSSSRWKRTVLWGSIAAFVLLVLFQMVPVPAALVQLLSPGTYDLYARTLPGYAEGKDFDSASLPAWLMARKGDRVPATAVAADPPLETPSLAAGGFPSRASSWRTFSVYPFETRQRLSILLSFIGVFAVITSWYRTKERLARLMAVIVFSGLALSIVGIVQKLTWNGKLLWVREGTYDNIFGPFVNRNSYAAFAGTVLPLAACMAFGALRHVDRGRRGALPRMLLWGFSAVAICGGIFYSLSRGGILCAVLSFGIVAALLFYYGRVGKELVVLGALALAAGGFLTWIGPEKVIERVGTLSQGRSIPSMEVRVGAWHRALGLIGSAPIVGSGLGTFRFSFMRFSPPGEGWWTEAHDEYVELICDTGLVGGAIFLCGAIAWLALVAHPSRFRGRDELYHYIGIVAGIAGLLVHSAISSNLQVPANGLLLTVLGAALICLVQIPSGRRRHEPSRATERVVPAEGGPR